MRYGKIHTDKIFIVPYSKTHGHILGAWLQPRFLIPIKSRIHLSNLRIAYSLDYINTDAYLASYIGSFVYVTVVKITMTRETVMVMIVTQIFVIIKPRPPVIRVSKMIFVVHRRQHNINWKMLARFQVESFDEFCQFSK